MLDGLLPTNGYSNHSNFYDLSASYEATALAMPRLFNLMLNVSTTRKQFLYRICGGALGACDPLFCHPSSRLPMLSKYKLVAGYGTAPYLRRYERRKILTSHPLPLV